MKRDNHTPKLNIAGNKKTDEYDDKNKLFGYPTGQLENLKIYFFINFAQHSLV